MNKILLVIAGGALGSLLRYMTSDLMQKYYQGGFPIGTFTVNIIGSFIIGILWSIAEIMNLSMSFRLFIFVGILGGFTTFSSFSIESINLIRDNHFKIALLYINATNVIGIAISFEGIFVGKYITELVK